MRLNCNSLQVVRKDSIQLDLPSEPVIDASKSLPISKNQFYPSSYVFSDAQNNESELMMKIIMLIVKLSDKILKHKLKKLEKGSISKIQTCNRRITKTRAGIIVKKTEGKMTTFESQNMRFTHFIDQSNIILPSLERALKSNKWKKSLKEKESLQVRKNKFIFARSSMHPLLPIFNMNEISRLLSALWNDHSNCTASDYFSLLSAFTQFTVQDTDSIPEFLYVCDFAEYKKDRESLKECIDDLSRTKHARPRL